MTPRTMTSNLLIDEEPLIVLPTLATAVGLNEAIILQQIHYWARINRRRNSEVHFMDGRWWTYNTAEGWQRDFPWWSIPTIRRTLNKLVDLGLIITAQYSKDPFDKTLWYSINYDGLQRLYEYLQADPEGVTPDVIKMITSMRSTGSPGNDASPDVIKMITSERSTCADRSTQSEQMIYTETYSTEIDDDLGASPPKNEDIDFMGGGEPQPGPVDGGAFTEPAPTPDECYFNGSLEKPQAVQWYEQQIGFLSSTEYDMVAGFHKRFPLSHIEEAFNRFLADRAKNPGKQYSRPGSYLEGILNRMVTEGLNDGQDTRSSTTGAGGRGAGANATQGRTPQRQRPQFGGDRRRSAAKPTQATPVTATTIEELERFEAEWSSPF